MHTDILIAFTGAERFACLALIVFPPAAITIAWAIRRGHDAPPTRPTAPR